MKLLTLDTSTEMLCVGVCHGDKTFIQDCLAPREHAKRILQTVDTLLQKADLTLAELDAVGVGIGPGSFTGLRTAASIAQGLCLGANLKAAPISSLQALAQSGFEKTDSDVILAAIDARMGEVYWQIYKAQEGLMEPFSEVQLTKPEAIKPDQACVALGSAVDSYLVDIESPNIGNKVSNITINSTAMLKIANNLTSNNALIPAAKINPVYTRNNVVNQK